jgi:hypothetical protein
VLPRCIHKTPKPQTVEKQSVWQPCWISAHKVKNDDSGYIPFGFAQTKNKVVESVLVFTGGVQFQDRDFKTLIRMFGNPKEVKEDKIQNLFGAKFVRFKALWLVPQGDAKLFGQNLNNKSAIDVVFISCCDEDSGSTLTDGNVFIIFHTVKMNPTVEDNQ